MVCGAVSSGQSPPLLSTSNVTMLGAASVSSANFAQSWQLDATGNWPEFRQLDTASSSQNLDQQRTSNQANELLGIAQRYGTAWAQPAYDRTGNMTTIPSGLNPATALDGVYDAWNRLVSITGVGYAYDGRNYRITRTVSGTTRHFYYTKRWQIIEERVGSSTSADRQFVWGLRYIDDLVCRDVSSTRLYALQDANWNVTAIVNTSGEVQQRFRYSPYGVPTILNPDFSIWTGDDSIQFEYLYCGYRWDNDTGTYDVRFRVLNPQTGLWLTRDPLGYVDDYNFYAYVTLGPLGATDPAGTDEYAPEVNPAKTNCLGYACRDDISATYPDDRASLHDTLKHYGFKCTTGISALDCKKHCNCEKWIVVYVYVKKGDDPLSIRRKFQGKDYWYDKWGFFRDSIDYHAIRGTGDEYAYQTHNELRTTAPFIRPRFKPTEAKPDYFDDNRNLTSACCCKGKKDE